MKAAPAPAHAAALAVALGVLLRLLLPGVDGPAEVEGTEAPLQDAFWYLEGAAGTVEVGREVEPEPFYDPPVWTHVARTWFRLAGVSWSSAHVLAGLVSCATLVLTWRAAAATLGPLSGACAALTLATLVPAVALGRSPLVYGPVGLALVLAAAAWLAARRRPPPQRLALEAAAWAVVLLAVALVRPPAGALAGGLGLASLVRARRPGLALGALAAVALLGALVVWALDPFHVVAENRLRVGRYLARDLSVGALCLRGLRLGAGTGLGRTAPGLLVAAGLGSLVLLRGWRALPPASREAAALAAGWVGTFALGAVVLDYRPLRYLLVVAPPLALLAGVGVVGLARAVRPSAPPPAWAVVLGGVVGMMGGASLFDLLLGGAAGGPALLVAAGIGATFASAGVAGAFDGPLRRLTPRLWPLLAGGLVLALALPALYGASVVALGPSWRARDAQAAVGRMLSPGASLAGPYASWAALGHGLERRRGAWITFAPEAVRDASIARLRELRTTHLVLGLEPTLNASVVRCFVEVGAPLELVGAFNAPLSGPVLVFRFAWAEAAGYRLSAFERRREGDQGHGAFERETDPILQGARVCALILDGDPGQARRLGTDPLVVANLTQILPNLHRLDDRP